MAGTYQLKLIDLLALIWRGENPFPLLPLNRPPEPVPVLVERE